MSLTAAAWGAPPVVVMVRTSDVTDPTPYELRLRSELAAEGIDAVVTNPSAPGGDVRQMAARFGATAVVDVVVSVNELATSIWAGDSNANIEVTRQLRVSNLQRDAVAVFALRTVDFLQGARLELEQQRRAKLATANSNAPKGPIENDPPPPTTTLQPNPGTAQPSAVKSSSRTHPSDREPRRRILEPRTGHVPAAERFRLELGYAVLLSSDRFGWSTAPTLSISYDFRAPWVFAATFVGPLVNHINSTSGDYRITVDQEFLQFALGRRTRLSTSLALEPYLALGGARYAADGRASPAPIVGHLATAWSLQTSVGGKVIGHLGSRWHWVGDVAGMGRWQSPKVQVDIGDLTGSSRWNLLIKLGLGWSF